MFKESKKLPVRGIEPRTLHKGSKRLNHCPSSVDKNSFTVIVYVNCFTWRLVTYVLRRTSRPTRPRHDVAGPSLHLNLLKAETGGEAELRGADVAAHSCPMEEQPAT